MFTTNQDHHIVHHLELEIKKKIVTYFYKLKLVISFMHYIKTKKRSLKYLTSFLLPTSHIAIDPSCEPVTSNIELLENEQTSTVVVSE